MAIIFSWPSGQSEEIKSRRDEGWTVLPSRFVHAAVLTLPPGVLRKVSHAQLVAMILDRLPVDPEDARVWAVRLPRPFWFRKFETVFACAVSNSALASSGFGPDDALIPEDIGIAAGLFQRKAPPVVALDSSGVLTLIGRAARSRAVNVVKRFYSDPAAVQEQLEDDLRLLSAQVNPSALVLADGGRIQPALSRLHDVRSPETREYIASNLARILSHPARWRWLCHPEPQTPAAEMEAAAEPVARRLVASIAGPVLRRAALAAALVLPVAALVYGGKNFQARQTTLNEQMRSIYQQRYGAAVPDPVRALEAKSKQMSRRPLGVPLQNWIGLLDEISRSARQKEIKLDETRLTGRQIDLGGRIENAGNLQAWIDALQSQPGVEEAFLSKSENDLKSKTTRFLVRLRMRSERSGE